MSGYTPVFDSVFTGTLCGKWPDTGLWVCLLAMADKNGVIDKTPQFISAVVGISVDELNACLARFMEPDPMSRSGEEDGRRLVLIDPSRSWGWRIVNHGKYRERARLAAKNARDVESGANAVRMQDRRRPPETAADPLSNANTDTNKEKREEGRSRASRLPEDFVLTSERRLVAEAERLPAERTFEKFCDYWRSAAGAKARKHDWDATWRNWCRSERDRGEANGARKQGDGKRASAVERVRDATAEWAAQRGVDPASI